MSKEVVESIKEFIRTMIGANILIVVTCLGIIKSGINMELGTFLIKWNVVLATFVGLNIGALMTAIPSAFDKWIHEKKIQTPLDLRSMDSLKK